jgi:hypothetical protein
MIHLSKVILLILFWFFYVHTSGSFGTDRQTDPEGFTSNRYTAERFIEKTSENRISLEASEGAKGTGKSIPSDSSEPDKPETRAETKSRDNRKTTNPSVEDFVPSEIIEADHAVDFPVDI